MAATKGKDGGFYLGSTLVTFMDNWTLNRATTTAETTQFGNDWEEHCATVKNWNASVSGTLDRSDASQAALLDQLEDGTVADVNARFYTSSTSSTYWSGSAVVESDSIGSPVKDKVAISINLKGNGELTWNE